MSNDRTVIRPIPPFVALAQELAALRQIPRNDSIAQIKAIRARELDHYAEYLHDNVNAVTGTETTLHLTGLTDIIIRELVVRAMSKEGVPATWQQSVGVFAIGGYGRGEFNPCSDVDLLMLARDGKIPDWLAAANAELQASLWDVKFNVGASMRCLPELERIIDEDFVTATAVLEQRPLLVSDALSASLQELLQRFRKRRSTPFLKYKLDELAKRREQAGVSLFQMEPNLKTNPGCLRDIQLLRNMAFIISGSRNLHNLTELEVVTDKDLNDVLAANDHLLRLRTLLHFQHKRKQDVFQLPDQLTMAKRLGHQAVSQLRAVENFMKNHYAQVLQVHQTVELTISRLKAKGFLGRWTLLIKTRKTIDADFSAIQGQIYTAHSTFWEQSDITLRLMRMCRTAQERGFRLSLELQRVIRNHLDVVSDRDRHDRQIARIFLSILGDLGRTQLILEDMHNCGFLGAYLPEFGNLTCHMQFDSYHQFTVDQHTLFAMGNLDKVSTGELKGLPNMPDILRQVKRKDLLGLGLLLHDMGKYMGRGHVARGAIMVAQVASRLGLDSAEEELVYWLVEKHVSLSDASRMRDFHEPGFLATFTEKMGTRERLDLLYCLTYADARAVGEGVLTGWQEAILHDLHSTVADQLKLNPITASVSRYERLVRDLKASGISEKLAQDFISDLGQNYLNQVPPGEVERHYKVVQEARGNTVGLDYSLRDKFVYLAAAIPDRHGLFADVTATLTGHGFNILDARTWISGSGMVIYSFRTDSIYPTRLKEEKSWDRLRKDLQAISAGTIDANAQLERRRQARIGTAPADSVFDDPAVKVEQRTSDNHTIVDVHVKDDVGLLSRLCRSISDFGCEIGYACINTMGDVAVDVFYVNRSGKKLSDDEAEALRTHLITALGLKIS